MKTVTRLTAIVALTLAITLSAFAGETLTPPCAPPEPGEVLTPPCAVAQNTNDGESATTQPLNNAADSSNDFLVDVIEIALSIF